MGLIFKRTYRAKDGTLRTCATWTIRYFRGGRPQQEHGFKRKGDAAHALKSREGKIADGVPLSAAALRTTFDEAAQAMLDDFTANGKRSRAVVARRLRKHLLPYFGGRRLADITADDVLAYIAKRQGETEVVRAAYDLRRRDGTVRRVPEQRRPIARPSNAAINRELQAFKRCYSLAMKAGKVFRAPDVPLLREAAPRAGFFDAAQVEAVCKHLSAPLAAVVRFAFITGWRVPSEVLPLEWRHVDFVAGEVRLDPGSTKNREGRVFPLTDDLRALLETQYAEHERLKKAGAICPRVFVRLVADSRGGTKHPKPIKAFTKAWQAACRAAGCPGRIPHDLRRSAVRNMVRATIPERVAMAMTGHRTRSVFERYNIVSEGDLREAARRLNGDSSVTVAPASATGASETA